MWYGTFKPRDRFNRRYVIIEAPSEELAKKRMIDLFGKGWENLYSQDDWNNPEIKKRMKQEKYLLLEEKEMKREFERTNRIRYKTIKL